MLAISCKYIFFLYARTFNNQHTFSLLRIHTWRSRSHPHLNNIRTFTSLLVHTASKINSRKYLSYTQTFAGISTSSLALGLDSLPPSNTQTLAFLSAHATRPRARFPANVFRGFISALGKRARRHAHTHTRSSLI